MIFEDYGRHFEHGVEEPKKKHPEGVVLDGGKVYIDGNPWDLKTVLVGIEINQEAIARGEKVEYHQAFLDKLLQAKDISATLPNYGEKQSEVLQPELLETVDASAPFQVELIDKGKARINRKIIVTFDSLFPEIERLEAELKTDAGNLQKKILLEAYQQAKQLMIASIQ